MKHLIPTNADNALLSAVTSMGLAFAKFKTLVAVAGLGAVFGAIIWSFANWVAGSSETLHHNIHHDGNSLKVMFVTSIIAVSLAIWMMANAPKSKND